MFGTMLALTNLKCEYLTNPLGIDVVRPRLSWQIDSTRRGACQRAFQIVASEVAPALQSDPVLWDSGKVNSGQSAHLPYAGSPLRSRQRVHWRLRIWDENEQPTAWSDPAWFEMGLLERQDWQAQWIGHFLVGGPYTPIPNPLFRKGFTIESEIRSARLYITALGLYEASINGSRVGEDILTPGWTDYSQRLRYQTYDVTGLLSPGYNVMGVILGDGWYCGHVAWHQRQNYGDRPYLLAQLEITFADGTSQTIVTDETWETAVGPTLKSDLIMGEAYDARLEIPGWDIPNHQSPTPNPWIPARVFPQPPGLALVAQNTPPVRAQGELASIAQPHLIKGWPQDRWIFDFGQNLVGRVRLKVKGERGATVILRFGEMLAKDGHLYTENLRSALQTDIYTLKGDPEGEIYEPGFTFHGFRYVEVCGLVDRPSRDLLTAIVLHTDNPPSLEFECSDPLLNQLHRNIEWGWKGNSVDIPTDCPQRDERLGWTGDAQVFVKTATYLTGAASFFTKWIQDLADSQLDSGAIPSVAPAISKMRTHDGGAAWSDAFIIIPWTVWQQYGDTRVLETHYEAMCRYMDYLVDHSPGLIRLLPSGEESVPGVQVAIGGYGDWLAQDGSRDNFGLTPRDLIGTAFLAYDVELMSQIASAIGKPEDASRFSALFEDTRQAFINRFITPGGLLVGQTQTGYILALYFDLVPEELRPAIVSALVEDIHNRVMHLSTGFVGTPYICQVLTAAGHLDLAYTLLLQKTFPSWLYSVLQGATTVWERWDGWTQENGFQDPGMNSFNHYVYGAVGTWMYENILGFQTDPKNPGFKHILFHPRIGGDITHARGKFHSLYGIIKSEWQIEGDSLVWEVTVPPNTTATAHIPATSHSRVLEGSTPVEASPGVDLLRQTPEALVVRLDSGNYRFTVNR